MAEIFSPSAALIRSWNASFYDNSTKKWIYGVLSLSPTEICFNSTDQNTSVVTQNICLKFDSIKSINKATSSFLFSALTVITNCGIVNWFSSFADRNSAYLIICHFFQAFLCLPSARASSLPLSKISGQRSQIGANILRSVHDSEETLKNAATKLVEQGHQLKSCAYTVEEIQDDLKIANRIADGLESWLGRWRIPHSHRTEELILVKNHDIPDVIDVEVLCSQITADSFGQQMLSVLRVAKGGVTILDLKQRIIHHFKWMDISRIRVISPWEVLLSRFLIGQPDLSYGLISMEMPTILRKFDKYAPNKLEYMNPMERKLESSEEASRNVRRADFGPGSRNISSSSGIVAGTYSHNQDQLSQAQETDVVTDHEISELSNSLARLKSLALNVEEEQNSQLDVIDRLTLSVDKTDNRLTSVNHQIKKMLN